MLATTTVVTAGFAAGFSLGLLSPSSVADVAAVVFAADEPPPLDELLPPDALPLDGLSPLDGAAALADAGSAAAELLLAVLLPLDAELLAAPPLPDEPVPLGALLGGAAACGALGGAYCTMA